MHSGSRPAGLVSKAKARSSAQTGLALAQSERVAAAARVAKRAQGGDSAPATLVLAAGVYTAALEMARCLNGEALKVEAARDMRAGRPALTRATAKAGS
ncbi:MAG: hypothetical protein MUF34_20100 [Polyangiaceae bacterium]|jgi:hypothetical protein|nr:hypothetical protein [Polyangiaceae bacterium]